MKESKLLKSFVFIKKMIIYIFFLYSLMHDHFFSRTLNRILRYRMQISFINGVFLSVYNKGKETDMSVMTTKDKIISKTMLNYTANPSHICFLCSDVL